MRTAKCIIKDIDISKLKYSGYNPRIDLKPGDAEYEKLKKSIEAFGYVEPVIWNQRTCNIVGGHQRVKILKELGYEKATCIVVDLDDMQEKTLNIALNKITGDWDMPLLLDILRELDESGADVCLSGFDTEELDEMFGTMNPDDLAGDDFDIDSAEKQLKTPYTKHGDIWLVGGHRIMCGDSTNEHDVTKLLDGIQADMCFTDPPYNVNYESQAAGKIMNDNMDDNKFLSFLTAAFKNIFFALKSGGAFYICHADTEGLNFRKAVNQSGLSFRQCLIWVKHHFVMGRQDYQWRHEPILYGWKPGAPHYFTSDRSNSTVIEDIKKTNIEKLKKSELVSLLKKLQQENEVKETAIFENKPGNSPDHPTMKPVRLCARCIQNSSRRGESVIDLFGGSGSTLIACEQINRTAYVMELDPKFCDIIILRYIKTFGDTENIRLLRSGTEIPIVETGLGMGGI